MSPVTSVRNLSETDETAAKS